MLALQKPDQQLRKEAPAARTRAATSRHRPKNTRLEFLRSSVETQRGSDRASPRRIKEKSPELRRIASAELVPIIQFPTNSQSLNPYSYLMNRPFIGTDPSGYEIECANSGKDCSLSGVQKIEVFKGKDGQVTAVASDAKGNMVKVEGISRPTSSGVEATVISQKTLQGAYKGDIASIGTLNKAFGGANSVSGGDYFREQMNRAAGSYAGGFMKTVATSAAMGAVCGLSNVAAGACMAFGLGQMEAGDPSGAAFTMAGAGGGLAAGRAGAVTEELAAPSVATARYNRSLYGGSQTTSEAARSLRVASENKPCPTCNAPQVSGTRNAPSPQHEPSLVRHYHDHGGHRMTDAQRRAYARSPSAFNGTQCLSCQRREGAVEARYSRQRNEELGLE